jgi:hypothetical protein
VGYNPGALSPISGPYWFGEGQQLYIGAFTGYVSIKMTNGANFQSLQVLTSAGYIGITTSFLGYEVLEQGSLLWPLSSTRLFPRPRFIQPRQF